MRLKGRKHRQIGKVTVDDLVKSQSTLETVARMHRLCDDQNVARPPPGKTSDQASGRCPRSPVVDSDKALVGVSHLSGDEGDRVDPSLHQPRLRVADLRRLRRHDRNAINRLGIEAAKKIRNLVRIAFVNMHDISTHHL